MSHFFTEKEGEEIQKMFENYYDDLLMYRGRIWYCRRPSSYLR